MTSLSPRALARIYQLTATSRPVDFSASALNSRCIRPRGAPAVNADTRAIVELAERIRQKLVSFAALPARDPKTGAFTVGGAVTAGALRKAWRTPGRITPRAQSKAAQPAPVAPGGRA